MVMADLAIVGGGAAGTSLFVQLVSGDVEGIRRVMFVEPRPLARGLAFDRPEPYVLCNTSVAVNSIHPELPTHFLAWLRQHPSACARWQVRRDTLSGDSFVPRGLFREYLDDRFAAALRVAAGHGIAVDHVPDRAAEVTVGGRGLLVHTVGGVTVPARYVVVCTGLSVPGATAAAVDASGGLVRSVVALRGDDDFLPERPVVAVIGTRQSAVDAAFVVTTARPDAHLVLMSRSARFPSVRTEMAERPGRHFTRAALDATLGLAPVALADRWYRLLLAEAAEHGHHPGARDRARWGLSGLADDLARTRGGLRALERVDRDAITVANEVWPFLREGQRTALRTAFGGLLRRHVSALPAVSAERMLRLHEQGRLRVTRGPRRWRVVGRTLEFTDFRGRVVTADRAVDATGFGTAGGPRLSRGLSRAVERDTCHVPIGADTGLFLLGPSVGDARAVTNYFNATARQARSIVGFLASHPQRVEERRMWS